MGRRERARDSNRRPSSSSTAVRSRALIAAASPPGRRPGRPDAAQPVRLRRPGRRRASSTTSADVSIAGLRATPGRADPACPRPADLSGPRRADRRHGAVASRSRSRSSRRPRRVDEPPVDREQVLLRDRPLVGDRHAQQHLALPLGVAAPCVQPRAAFSRPTSRPLTGALVQQRDDAPVELVDLAAEPLERGRHVAVWPFVVRRRRSWHALVSHAGRRSVGRSPRAPGGSPREPWPTNERQRDVGEEVDVAERLARRTGRTGGPR